MAALGGLAMAVSANAAFIEVTADISADTRWTRDNVYILTKAIYVLPPAVLTIEPGTVIRGVRDTDYGLAADLEPGALLVARGAKIIANGTADDPIIFTSIDDPYVPGGNATIPPTVNGFPVLPRNYSPDGPANNNGFAYTSQWGGLVLLGEAPIGFDGQDPSSLSYDPITNTFTDTAFPNMRYPDGAYTGIGADMKGGNGVAIGLIEGANLTTKSVTSYTEPFPGATNVPASGTVIGGVYGGLNRNDNSGTLRFVASRYGGFKLGSDNELNGITWGACGTGTVSEWLESYANSDDGFEIFGGFNNLRYLFALYQGDDGIDGDQGYNGNIQFVFQVQDVSIARSGYADNSVPGRVDAPGDNSAEWDGSEGSVQDGSVTPNTNQYIYNFTFLPSPATGKNAILSRRGVAGHWYNGLFQNVPNRAFNEVAPVTSTRNFHVYSTVSTNKFGTTIYDSAASTALAQEMQGIGRLTKNGLDPRLANGAAAAVPTNFNVPADRTDSYPFSGFTKVAFAGGMRDNNMLKGWTIADRLQLLPAGNVARPAVTLGVSGSNPTVSFNSDSGVGGRAVLYVVEKSTDKRVWTPIAVVSDNNNVSAPSTLANPVADASSTVFATQDANAAAGTVQITDTTTTLASGTPVYYRVIPL